ncbi:MAG: hypothetical protein KC620_07610 [Myxococcales bacterium]|nr:hypothetical protein [Myxococcales bacterium]
MIALLIVLLAPTPADAALDAAVQCYADLDYACAEARLAEALAGELSPEREVQARLHEALLALAWRDEPRARRAVRALYAIDPQHRAEGVPPQLARLLEEERPPPPPPPRLLARADFRASFLFGQDADRWSDGLGVEGGVGLLLFDALVLEAAATWSDHAPKVFSLRGLTLWSVAAGAGLRARLGPLRLSGGLNMGLAHIGADGVLIDQDDYAVLIEAPFDLHWPLLAGFGPGVRVAPRLLLVDDADRAAASYILPVMIGLRYGD